MKGQAVVFPNQNQVRFQEVEIPNPRPTDVVIDVEYSWISIGTESSYLRGERIAGEQMYRQGDPWPFPYIAGYQKTGVIRAVGEKVSEFRPGDPVFATISSVSGMFFPYAGHINPAVTPVDQVWKLPDGADGEMYSGAVLTQVGYNCGTRPDVREGELVVVIGDGLVGQWSAQTLLSRSARVVVLGRRDARLQMLPAGVIGVNVRSQPIAEAIGEFRNIRAVVDTVGDMDTVRTLASRMAHDGHLVSAGFLADQGMVDIQELRKGETTLHAPSGWTRARMDQTLAAISDGRLTTAPLITHRFAAANAEHAWETIQDRSQNCLGVILHWA